MSSGFIRKPADADPIPLVSNLVLVLWEQMSTILIIEDHKELSEAYAEALSQANPFHEIVLSHTGEDGIEAALRARPDLIILDLSLPGTPGIEVAQILLESGILPGAPLIIASALGELAEAVAQSYEAIFLAKPVELTSLLGVVESALARAEQ